MEEAIKALKKVIAEGYKLKAQHNNPDWRKALENAEAVVLNHKKEKEDGRS